MKKNSYQYRLNRFIIGNDTLNRIGNGKEYYLKVLKTYQVFILIKKWFAKIPIPLSFITAAFKQYK